MHGRIIAGIGAAFDPEVERLKSEARRLGANPDTAATAEQLREVVESKERMNARRALLDGGPPSDVSNAAAEALQLAARMSDAGYTRAQILATVRPMLVDPSRTITGKKERQARRAARKAAGKGIFRKIGAALKNVGSFVWKGVAKLNPVLAGARVATLSLVAKNAGGIADRMRAQGSDTMRRKWENLGGDFAKLQKAVEKGSGQRITGLCGVDDDNDPAPDTSAAEDAAAGGASKDPLDKLWELAKPVLETLLGAVGVKVEGKGKETRIKVAKGGALDVRARSEMQRAFGKAETAVTRAVRGQAADALDPDTGGGAGYNGGGAKIDGGTMALLFGGLVVIFAASKR